MKPDSFGGTATGSFVLDMPMREDLKFTDVKLRGEARLDGSLRGADGGLDRPQRAFDRNPILLGAVARGGDVGFAAAVGAEVEREAGDSLGDVERRPGRILGEEYCLIDSGTPVGGRRLSRRGGSRLGG